MGHEKASVQTLRRWGHEKWNLGNWKCDWKNKMIRKIWKGIGNNWKELLEGLEMKLYYTIINHEQLEEITSNN